MLKWIWGVIWGRTPKYEATTCQCGHGLCFHEKKDGDDSGCNYRKVVDEYGNTRDCRCCRFVPDIYVETERLLAATTESRAGE